MKRPLILMLCALGAAIAAGPAEARRSAQNDRRVECQAPHRGHQAARCAARSAKRGAVVASNRGSRHRAAARGQRGQASVYAHSLAGRRMADGTRFNPRASVMASRTLPLGSHARVTNLRNGRTTVVQVRDRGPHRRGRIVDLSPGVAAQLGMAGGLAPVEVTPLTLASRAEAAPIQR